MNYLEALQSGKRYCRNHGVQPWRKATRGFTDTDERCETVENMLSNDWIVEEPVYTFTRDTFMRAVSDAWKAAEYDNYTVLPLPIHKFIKHLTDHLEIK